MSKGRKAETGSSPRLIEPATPKRLRGWLALVPAVAGVATLVLSRLGDGSNAVLGIVGIGFAVIFLVAVARAAEETARGSGKFWDHVVRAMVLFVLLYVALLAIFVFPDLYRQLRDKFKPSGIAAYDPPSSQASDSGADSPGKTQAPDALRLHGVSGSLEDLFTQIDRGNAHLAGQLVQSGVRIDTMLEGHANSALMYAAQHGTSAVLQSIIQHATPDQLHSMVRLDEHSMLILGGRTEAPNVLAALIRRVERSLQLQAIWAKQYADHWGGFNKLTTDITLALNNYLGYDDKDEVLLKAIADFDIPVEGVPPNTSKKARVLYLAQIWTRSMINLHRAGTLIHDRDFDKIALFLFASRPGNRGLLSEVMELGIDPHQRFSLDDHGSIHGFAETISAMEIAAASPDPIALARWLETHGLPPTAGDDGETLLMIAAANVNVDGARLVINKSGPGSEIVHSRDVKNRTALSYLASAGCYEDSLDVLEILREAGADVNAADIDGRTPLMIAASKDCLPMVRGLLSAGARTDAIDRDGRRAIDFVRSHDKNISHDWGEWPRSAIRQALAS